MGQATAPPEQGSRAAPGYPVQQPGQQQGYPPMNNQPGYPPVTGQQQAYPPQGPSYPQYGDSRPGYFQEPPGKGSQYQGQPPPHPQPFQVAQGGPQGGAYQAPPHQQSVRHGCCNIQMALFGIGWIFPILWIFGAFFGLFTRGRPRKHPTENVWWMVNVVMTVLLTIAVIVIGIVTRRSGCHNYRSGGSTYYSC